MGSKIIIMLMFLGVVYVPFAPQVNAFIAFLTQGADSFIGSWLDLRSSGLFSIINACLANSMISYILAFGLFGFFVRGIFKGI